MMFPVIEQNVYVGPVQTVRQSLYVELNIQRHHCISVFHNAQHNSQIMMAAASKEADLRPVADSGILLFCPGCYGVALFRKLTVSNVINNIIVLIAQEHILPVLFSCIFYKVADCFCVFVSNHDLPH